MTADDGSITFKGVNTATNEDSNSNDVDDKIVKSKADIKPETKTEKKTETKSTENEPIVKSKMAIMAQTGTHHSNLITWLEQLFN